MDSQLVNHKALPSLTKDDTQKQMIYVFQTMPDQTCLGPNPSSMTFVKDETDKRMTLTYPYTHSDESTY